ncbi:efflux RND transporter permease subunit [Shigella flexneri]
MIWNCWTTLAHEKLTQARNELLSLAAQSPYQLPGYAERPEDMPMFKVNVNAAKAEANGCGARLISTETISTAFGSSDVNDLLNQGRGEKSVCPAVHAVPDVAG